MLDALKTLFENNVISGDIKESIEKAWDRKLTEHREQVSQQLREEFANGFRPVLNAWAFLRGEYDANGFTEDLLDHLHATVIAQQRQIDLLVREVSALKQQQADSQPAGFRSLRDELPPHY